MLFILKILLTVIIAIVASVIIFVKVRRSKKNQWRLLLCAVPFVLAVVVIKFLGQMPMRMYLKDFTEVTGIAMPEGARILYKSSTIPPTDDHASIMLVRVGEEVYASLPAHLLKNALTETQDSLFAWIPELLADHGDFNVERTFELKQGKVHHRAYLLSDHETILIRREKYKYDVDRSE